jgi:hypothetical protein
MSTIRDIITSTLRSHGIVPENYTDAVDTVTEALTLAANDVVDTIVDRVQSLELPVSEGEVRQFLDAVGLPSRPEPEPLPEPSFWTKLEAGPVTRAEFNSLVEAVGKLTALAERHLGVSE